MKQPIIRNNNDKIIGKYYLVLEIHDKNLHEADVLYYLSVYNPQPTQKIKTTVIAEVEHT